MLAACPREELTSMEEAMQPGGKLRSQGRGARSSPGVELDVCLEVKGDAGDVPEPGAGSGRPEVTLWRGAAFEEGAPLVKCWQAGLHGTAWVVPVPGPASPPRGLSKGPSPAAELELAMMSAAQGECSAHG